MFTVIKSFNQIAIKNKSLIACDIDNTVLKFNGITPTWWDNVYKNNRKLFGNTNFAYEISLDKWISHIKITKPEHTDSSGFCNMLHNCNITNSEFVFVTARNIKFEEMTRVHLTDIGIDMSKYKIHFLGDYCKGKYIKNYLFNNTIHTSIVFIDDLEHNLLGVKNELSDMVQCYKFEI